MLDGVSDAIPNCKFNQALSLIASVSSSFARDVNHDEVHSEVRQLRQEVDFIRQELTALRQELNQLRRLSNQPAAQQLATSSTQGSSNIMPYAGEPPGDPSRILSRCKGSLPAVSLSLVGDTNGRQIRTCEDVLKRFRIRSHAEGTLRPLLRWEFPVLGGARTFSESILLNAARSRCIGQVGLCKLSVRTR